MSKKCSMPSVLDAHSGLSYCSCGVCLGRRWNRNEVLKLSLKLWLFTITSCGLIAQEVENTTKDNGKKDFWKAKDAAKGARKHNQDSIDLPWINDAIFRASQRPNRMDKSILLVSWLPHNDRHLQVRNLETAKPIWKLPWIGRKRRSAPWSYGRKVRFSENHSQTCSSSMWTRTSECLHSKGRKRAPKTIQWNTASWPWVAQPQLEIPLVAGIIFIFNTVVGVSNMARTTPRRMARPLLVWRVMLQTRSSHVDFLLHRFRLQTQANVVHAMVRWI